MDKKELETRTKDFAIATIRFVEDFRPSLAARVVGNQLLRSGTSVGANYREANRAVSRRDFAHRIAVTEKEASETLYWLELCAASKLGDASRCKDLIREADELLAIFTAIGRSIRQAGSVFSRGPENRVSDSNRSMYSADRIEPDVSQLIVPDLIDDAVPDRDRDE